jgi:Peptidase M10 serralysin C terminal
MGNPFASNPAVAGQAFESATSRPLQMGSAAGGSSNGGTLAINNGLVDQLNAGVAWHTSAQVTAASISFGITTSAAFANASSLGAGWAPLTDTQANAVRMVIDLWDDVIASSINAATDPNAADIKLSNTSTGVDFAQGYLPGTTGAEAAIHQRISGSVWLNAGSGTLQNPALGTYGFTTLIHEVGHALGLDHAGTYNGAGAAYGNAGTGWLFTEDSRQYTVMSYFDAGSTGADWHGLDPQTPMVYDVLAIQQLYGADNATRSGNTVYGFNANAGNKIYDFAQNSNPVLTIWDGSGTDIIDLSGWSSGSVLSLVAGSYSSANTMTKNIAIAYNVDIENARTGAGNDTVTGNDLDNLLFSNAGDDTVIGGGGDDVINGGAGRDVLTGGAGDDRIYIDASDDLNRLSGGTGTDTLVQSGFHADFDFAAHGFEKMQSVYRDSAGADWRERIDTYDASNRIIKSETVLDNGTRNVTSGSTGGGSTAGVDRPPQQKIAITSNGAGVKASLRVADGEQEVGVVNAQVFNGASKPAYSIVGGSDAAKFRIDQTTGALSFATAIDSANPEDSNHNNIYNVAVRASSGRVADVQRLSVKVTGSGDAPSLWIKSFDRHGVVPIREDKDLAVRMGASDPDRADKLSFSIAGGADAADFTMNARTGKMYFKESSDFEARRDSNMDNVFEVLVKVSDGLLDAVKSVRIQIIDKPEALPKQLASVEALKAFDFDSFGAPVPAADHPHEAPHCYPEMVETSQIQHIFADDWLFG